MTQFFVNFNNSLNSVLAEMALTLPFVIVTSIVAGGIIGFIKFIKLCRMEYENENQQNKTN